MGHDTTRPSPVKPTEGSEPSRKKVPPPNFKVAFRHYPLSRGNGKTLRVKVH